MEEVYMKANELWTQFKKENNIKEDTYETWAFGASPDKLLDLVLEGKKTGTASAYDLYRLGKEPLPKEGDYSVLLDSKGNAKCIIQTIKLSVVPFLEVTADHARKEGEGDLGLAYWREVHEAFFCESLKEIKLDFTDTMDVLCEEFIVVYKADH